MRACRQAPAVKGCPSTAQSREWLKRGRRRLDATGGRVGVARWNPRGLNLSREMQNLHDFGRIAPANERDAIWIYCVRPKNKAQYIVVFWLDIPRSRANIGRPELKQTSRKRSQRFAGFRLKKSLFLFVFWRPRGGASQKVEGENGTRRSSRHHRHRAANRAER